MGHSQQSVRAADPLSDVVPLGHSVVEMDAAGQYVPDVNPLVHMVGNASRPEQNDPAGQRTAGKPVVPPIK